MKVIKPPHELKTFGNTTIFLGGSIEMGGAEDWQIKLSDTFNGERITFWNPRRDDWDSSWKQDPTPGTEFYKQVTWELNAQDNADMIVYYFDPETKSPITLLELGIYKDKNVVVCCPDGYWRKGNVVMVCRKYGIKFVESFDNLVRAITIELVI